MENTFNNNQKYVKSKFFSKVKLALSHIPFMSEVISMYFCAIDPLTPIHAKITIFSALSYFISPLDIIPDLLPGGYADDIAALLTALSTIEIYITDDHRIKAQQWLLSEI